VKKEQLCENKVGDYVKNDYVKFVPKINLKFMKKERLCKNYVPINDDANFPYSFSTVDQRIWGNGEGEGEKN
jgi:hypothetical protein